MEHNICISETNRWQSNENFNNPLTNDINFSAYFSSSVRNPETINPLQLHRFQSNSQNADSIQFSSFPNEPKKRKRVGNEKSDPVQSSHSKKICADKTERKPPVEYSFIKEENNDDNPVLTFLIDWESQTHEFKINKDDLLKYPNSSFAALYNPIFNEDTESFSIENVNPKFLHTIFQHLVDFEPSNTCELSPQVNFKLKGISYLSKTYSTDNKALTRLTEIILNIFCVNAKLNVNTDECTKKIVIKFTESESSFFCKRDIIREFVENYCANPTRNLIDLSDYSWNEFFELVKTCKRFCYDDLIDDLDFTIYTNQSAHYINSRAQIKIAINKPKLVLTNVNFGSIFKQVFEFATNEHEYIKLKYIYNELTMRIATNLALAIQFDNINALKKEIRIASSSNLQRDLEIAIKLFPEDCTFVIDAVSDDQLLFLGKFGFDPPCGLMDFRPLGDFNPYGLLDYRQLLSKPELMGHILTNKKIKIEALLIPYDLTKENVDFYNLTILKDLKLIYIHFVGLGPMYPKDIEDHLDYIRNYLMKNTNIQRVAYFEANVLRTFSLEDGKVPGVAYFKALGNVLRSFSVKEDGKVPIHEGTEIDMEE